MSATAHIELIAWVLVVFAKCTLEVCWSVSAIADHSSIWIVIRVIKNAWCGWYTTLI